jgi:hypothetical protein
LVGKLVREITTRVQLQAAVAVEKLVAEAGDRFGNPEEGEHPPLEAITRRLVKTQQAEKT